MRRFVVLILATAMLVCGSNHPSSALVMALGCGGFVDHSQKLKHNITDCGSSPALTITADNVTLNLNGHTVDGPGTGVGIQALGQSNVNVVNGTVKEFTTGVDFENGHADAARHLTIRSSNSGFRMFQTTGQGGIFSSRILGDSGAAAVTLISAHRETVRSNVISGASGGIDVIGSSGELVVAGNRLTGPSTGGVGIDVSTSGTANYIRGNSVTGYTNGIAVSGSSVSQYLLQNTLRNAIVNGIRVDSGAQSIYIGGNRSSRSGGDGILVSASGSTIKIGSNVTDKNALYGIDAVVSNDDAGGNKAKGNGFIEQCVGVICL